MNVHEGLFQMSFRFDFGWNSFDYILELDIIVSFVKQLIFLDEIK